MAEMALSMAERTEHIAKKDLCAQEGSSKGGGGSSSHLAIQKPPAVGTGPWVLSHAGLFHPTRTGHLVDGLPSSWGPPQTSAWLQVFSFRPQPKEAFLSTS